MILAEAFSCGTPAIVPDFGNAGSLVQEGISGWHYTPNDSESLIKVIHHRTDLTESVYSAFRTHFSSEQNYRTLMKIYDAVLQGKETR